MQTFYEFFSHIFMCFNSTYSLYLKSNLLFFKKKENLKNMRFKLECSFLAWLLGIHGQCTYIHCLAPVRLRVQGTVLHWDITHWGFMPAPRPLSLSVTSYAEDILTPMVRHILVQIIEHKRKNFLFSYCQHSTNFQIHSIPNSGGSVFEG